MNSAPARPAHHLTAVAGAVVLLAAGVFVLTCWGSRGAAHPDVRLDEWHHLYLGLVLAGLAVMRQHPGLMAIAAGIALDDSWQHLRHATGGIDYVSPLHGLFARHLWPLEPIRWITAWLDQLLA